jgi:plasmid stabilization system protein ParE
MTDEVDKKYTVTVTATAREAIREQVRYIAIDQRAPQNAAEWLGRVWSCIDQLEFLPRRFAAADGYDHLPYVVRRVVLDNHLILFTIDDACDTVYIVGLRHGARLPRSSDIPRTPTREEPGGE